ncbi:hypothetical protein C9374_011791 [Naegleria lovaniensis]|uniref:Uncharacterized protein n=1 Tax=Naegleria lovaniensis TaxID=51637 RepID=A0AA88KIA6_NAELO|nr:uncharacterized protein C9374_011791 [Naegleria lovaniensis]KAG2373702.1 hypothetical protein C9374_011791 [Naegleria lovaniensis]
MFQSFTKAFQKYYHHEQQYSALLSSVRRRNILSCHRNTLYTSKNSQYDFDIEKINNHHQYRNFQSSLSLNNVKIAFQEVANKNTALQEIDALLGRQKPPAFEYIYVEPSIFTNPVFWNSDSSVNPYGHAAIRYTNPETGKSMVMNIVGKPGHRMVNFIPAEEYLFGHPSKCSIEDGNEQGGIYCRTMIGFRFEEWPQEYITAMHNYYQNVQNLGDAKLAKYSMVLGPIYNLLRKIKWFSGVAERGNCAFWTTQGLVNAHVLSSATSWPKYSCMKLYTKVVFNKIEMKEKWEQLKQRTSQMIVPNALQSSSPTIMIDHDEEELYSRINEKFFEKSETEQERLLAPFWKRSNFNIVTYRCSDESVSTSSLKGWVKPFRQLEHLIFQQMDEMANVVVEVKTKELDNDEEMSIAVPSLKEATHRPFW